MFHETLIIYKVHQILPDNFRFGQEYHHILFLRFFSKYTIRLGTRGHLFDVLQTNRDHQRNPKEIFNKRGGTNN